MNLLDEKKEVGVVPRTAEGGAERIGKRERKEEKEERRGGKSKAMIGEIEDQKTGKKVHVWRVGGGGRFQLPSALCFLSVSVFKNFPGLACSSSLSRDAC